MSLAALTKPILRVMAENSPMRIEDTDASAGFLDCELLCGNSLSIIPTISKKVDLTFMDPPFNQQKDYALHDDNMPQEQYWEMMKDVCRSIYGITREGGCLYFMQREKIRNMSCE